MNENSQKRQQGMRRSAGSRPASRSPGSGRPARRLRLMTLAFQIMVGLLLLTLFTRLNEVYRAYAASALRPNKTAAAEPSVRQPLPAPAQPEREPAVTPPAETDQPVPDSIPVPTPPSAHPAEKEGSVELVLAPSRNGGYYAKGQINRQDVVFLVDTGASLVAVPERLKWTLNLTRGQYLEGSTAGGVTGMYETEIERLSIGPISLRDVPAVLNPDAPDDVVLLGMSALREVRMVHQDNRLVLQQSVRPGAQTKDDGAASRAVQAPRLTKPLRECMGTDKVVNAKVLRCMQGVDESPDDAAAPAGD